jgi:hypothetical protein
VLSPLFLFPNFSKEWKGPFIWRTTNYINGKKCDVGNEPLKCNADTFITPRVSFKDCVM